MQTKFLIFILLTFIIILAEIEAKGGRGRGGNYGDLSLGVILSIIGIVSGIVLITGLCICYRNKICCWYQGEGEVIYRKSTCNGIFC